MAGKRSPWSRLGALLALEVSAESLEAYRRASVLVQELRGEVEDRRLACVMEGVDPWSMPPGTRAGFLCAWNAIALQALGDAMLDADADVSPWTAGHVPEITRDEVEAYYGEVERWVDRARQAFANPDYQLDVAVPATLPQPEPRTSFNPPRARDMHLWSVRAAMRAVGELTAAAMALLPDAAADPARRQVRSIRRQYEAARSAARDVERLYHFATRADVPRVLGRVRDTIESLYELGQLVAMPVLADTPDRVLMGIRADRASPWGPPRPSAQAIGPLPGLAGVDPWCLTDPAAHGGVRGKVERLGRMWADDGARALQFHETIQAALERGNITKTTDEKGSPFWLWCPWGPIYVARRIMYLDGIEIPPGQRFVLDTGRGDDDGPVRILCRLVAGDLPPVPRQTRGPVRHR